MWCICFDISAIVLTLMHACVSYHHTATSLNVYSLNHTCGHLTMLNTVLHYSYLSYWPLADNKIAYYRVCSISYANFQHPTCPKPWSKLFVPAHHNKQRSNGGYAFIFHPWLRRHGSRYYLRLLASGCTVALWRPLSSCSLKPYTTRHNLNQNLHCMLALHPSSDDNLAK